MTPRVFTIPASAPFLPTLIQALTTGRLGFAVAGDPLALAAATLYLPTRRACRLARDAFLDAGKGNAAILPRIVAIGDIDEDEIAFAEAASGDIAADALALPEALGGLERRLLLTQLVTKWASSPELHGAQRHAAGRPDTGGGLRARRRSGAADRRHDDARRGVGSARRSRARNFRRILAAHAAILADRTRGLAGDVARARLLSSRSSARDALIKAEAARLCPQDRRAGDRRGLDRLDSVDCRIDCHHRAPAAWRRGAAGPRYRSRRGIVAADRREKRIDGAGTSAIRHAGLARAHRHRPRRRRQLWRSRAGASGLSRKRCARRPRPTCGGKKPPTRHSKRMPTPRSTRWP